MLIWMVEPSRGEFMNGSVYYNGHVDTHDDMAR
jgi:hypothetical protein